jgi:NAD(P)H-flavin reductase/hemoglobin-like flavoprotein
VGIRRLLLDWFTRVEEEPDDRFAAAETGSDGYWAPPPVLEIRDLPDPPPVPQEPVGGGLVVGTVERRRPPLELPSFYTPPPPDPAPVAKAIVPSPAELAVERATVREAWDVVGDRLDQLVRSFYAELFLALPGEAIDMFPSSMVQQREDFGRALVQWVVTDDPETMAAHLDQLGADHRKFNVEPRHYEVAGAALVRAWSRLAGSKWTAEHETAVVASYTRLATIMIDGAMRTQDQPASWGAQVIEHQRVLRDFAVLRIQPDAPYPYKAGQYLTLELPSHRREWRQMSIASAPRADNTFDIQVRAVGATGVSAALVANTKPGDRLRLGPPRGNDLVVEPGTVPGGLLCVASGTGAAPIAAVVESILSWQEPPQLYAFVGGRTKFDIYPVSQLNQLIQAGGKWRQVQVHGVVSDDPSYAGYRGRVENIVPSLHDWAQLGVDVLVSGPNPMIATTVTNLAGIGVPLAKIHFDQYDAAA